ncbi:50S ribosomal protein L10 [Pseudostreptobacillus hongkongensis]|uniref:50S ribosomal protein L10 n=1 Tax=Pseudostreptobacillus hongkongensis TaxID=1162717 RepID=UPI00082C978E|nr:50S ribosomal protein L10 [Pseudostreptobacillus hongkongensis]
MASKANLEAVEMLTEKLRSAKAIVFVDYKGITVNEDTKLRSEARNANVEYFVAKNRLFQIALKNVGIDVETKELTEGTTSFALGMEDGVAPSKLIYDFAKDFKGEKLKIKGGIIDGQVVDKATVEALAKLPSRSELLGMIAYGLLSPVRMLAVGLTNVAEQKEA